MVISDYTVNGTITYQQLDDSKIELLLDKAKVAAFTVDDIDAAQADIAILNESTSDMAEQMKITIEKQVFGTVYADAGSTITSQQVTKANVLDWLVDAGTELDEMNTPGEGRWALIPPWIAGMIKKSDLKDASLSGDGSSILRNGKLGMIDRFTLYVNNNLTGSDTSGVPRQCMAGHKDAIAFAAQVTKVENLRLESTFASAVRALNVYGFKTVHAPALVSMPAYK